MVEGESTGRRGGKGGDVEEKECIRKRSEGGREREREIDIRD